MTTKLYWEFLPEWCAWWLMIPVNATESKRGYGPFETTFEIQAAADLHETPFPVKEPTK